MQDPTSLIEALNEDCQRADELLDRIEALNASLALAHLPMAMGTN